MKQRNLAPMLLLALIAIAVDRAAAATYFEAGDAGQLPELAQYVAIVGPVDAIVGRIENAFDADLFRLTIEVPADFSARVIPTEDQAVDPQLFLFDEWARGVVADDNQLQTPLPELPVGTLTGRAAGVYLLAVSAADCDPLGIYGEIFPDMLSGLRRPTGASVFDRLLSWSLDFTAAGGNYAIALTGVTGIVESTLLPGDYNHNGTVDAADYTVWRDSLGQSGAGLAADGSGLGGSPDGVVDQFDYDFWKTHFGEMAGAGAGSFGVADAGVPEPSAACLAALAIVGLFAVGRRN